MARTPIIGGNWKMNLSLPDAQQLGSRLRTQLGSHRVAQVVIFPPTPYLVPLHIKLQQSAVELGVQDVHPHSNGPFTSGVSASMVKSIGCKWALVGHSERRTWFEDTDQRVTDKLRAVLGAGLHPILCVGESLADRRANRTFDVLAQQLESALSPHDAAALAKLVIAYEPVWAIGTGVTATPAQAGEVHGWVRARLSSHFGTPFADALRIQYGGSVKPGNAAELMKSTDIDGALVGGASLDATAFGSIVRAASVRPRSW